MFLCKPIIVALGWIMTFAFKYHVSHRVHFVGVASQLTVASSKGRTRKLVNLNVLSKSCVRSQDEYVGIPVFKFTFICVVFMRIIDYEMK